MNIKRTKFELSNTEDERAGEVEFPHLIFLGSRLTIISYSCEPHILLAEQYMNANMFNALFKRTSLLCLSNEMQGCCDRRIHSRSDRAGRHVMISMTSAVELDS